VKTFLLAEPYRFELMERAKPVPGPGEALVRVLSAGICGSEIHGYHGTHFGRKPPVIMGHEVCGVVESLGEGAQEPAVGTRVVAIPQRSCNVCRSCQEGHPNWCSERIMLGFTKWPGAYEEFFLITAQLLFPAPDRYTSQEATLLEPFACSVHAVRRADVRLGDSVLVLGTGVIGLLAVVAAKLAGATRIVATARSEYNLEHARRLGATAVWNTREGSVAEFVRQITDCRGVDHAILAVGSRDALRDAFASVRKGGNIVNVATFDTPPAFDIEAPQLMEQAVLGSVTYDEEDFRIVREVANELHPLISPLITHDFPAERIAEAFAFIEEHKEPRLRVTLTFA